MENTAKSFLKVIFLNAFGLMTFLSLNAYANVASNGMEATKISFEINLIKKDIKRYQENIQEIDDKLKRKKENTKWYQRKKRNRYSLTMFFKKTFYKVAIFFKQKKVDSLVKERNLMLKKAIL